MQIYIVVTSENRQTKVLGMFTHDKLPEAEAMASRECETRRATVKVLRFPIYQGQEILQCKPV